MVMALVNPDHLFLIDVEFYGADQVLPTYLVFKDGNIAALVENKRSDTRFVNGRTLTLARTLVSALNSHQVPLAIYIRLFFFFLL